MSEYYDGGSMRGSGIYVETVAKIVTCPNCYKSWTDDFVSDDWGRIEEDVYCPMCKTDFFFESTVREQNEF